MRTVAGIPCFNEERYIGTVVLKAKKHVDAVLVVNDGSKDDTALIAHDAGAMVFSYTKNQGVGIATQTIIERAIDYGADVLVLLDGDGQHDPDQIPLVIAPILGEGLDVVIGSRFLGNHTRPPLYRRIGQHVLTTSTNWASGCKLTDSQSGFRALSSRAMRSMFLCEPGFSIHSEMQFQIARYNLKYTEVPIKVSYHDGAKRNPFVHGLGVLGRVGLISRRR